MTFIPKPHEIYKHFKGNLYQVVTIAEHSETGEQLVIYQALYGDFKTYARPLAQRFRFELQGAEADRQAHEADAVSGTQTAAVQTKTAKMPSTASQPAAAQETPIVAQNIAAQATATAAQTIIAPVSPAEDEEPALDPLVLEFLDADSYEEKLNILAGLHHRITNEMITTMAISCDIEVTDGEPEERYEELKNCLLTMEKFECNRLR